MLIQSFPAYPYSDKRFPINWSRTFLTYIVERISAHIPFGVTRISPTEGFSSHSVPVTRHESGGIITANIRTARISHC